MHRISNVKNAKLHVRSAEGALFSGMIDAFERKWTDIKEQAFSWIKKMISFVTILEKFYDFCQVWKLFHTSSNYYKIFDCFENLEGYEKYGLIWN